MRISTEIRNPAPYLDADSMIESWMGLFRPLGIKLLFTMAPEWSVRALEAVINALGEAIRIAADPNSPLRDVEAAFDKAALLTRLNSQDAPPGFRDQLLQVLSLKGPLKIKGFKGKILAACLILHFVLQNYST